MTIKAGNYSISSVFGGITEPLRQEVTAFWMQNGAIGNVAEAKRRSSELVCVARNAANEIVGVNTAYVSTFEPDDERWFLYRMFVRSQDRHLHLARAMMRAAVDTLRTRCDSNAIRGIALVTENSKLMRAGGRRQLTALGWSRAGKDSRGLDLWTMAFE